MPTEIRVTVGGQREIIEKIKQHPVKARRAARRAINKTLTTTRASVSQQLRAEYKLAARLIKDRLRITRATDQSLAGVIRPLGKGIPLIHFSARQTRRGVSYQSRSGRELLSSAFLHQTTSRGLQVLRRKTDESRPSGLVGRLPVFMQYGPGLPDMFRGILDELVVDVSDVLRKNFDRELTYELGRV